MVQLQKVHGSQNQFFLLDQTQLQQPLSEKELVNLDQQLTNPQTGPLGRADGLLVVSTSQHPQVLGRMQVLNADGSWATMCGNGLRTVGRYLADKYQQKTFRVETAQADLQVSCQPDWAPNVRAISVEISPVSFVAADLPFENLGTEKLFNQVVPKLDSELKFTAVAVPNPHLISLVTSAVLKSNLLEQLGTELNQPNLYFPDGVNVSFAQVIDSSHLFVKTFERGVGFTNACGTGMSAASLVFALTQPSEKVLEKLITVTNPGGFVQIRLHKVAQGYWIELIGNATITNYLQTTELQLHQAHPDFSKWQIVATQEDTAYQKFIAQ